MKRHLVLFLLAGCSTVPQPRVQPSGVAIAEGDDVRWPRERRTFVGTLHRTPALVTLELPDTIEPAIVALDADALADVADGAQVAVSGIGRRSSPAEAAAGATIALGDVAIATADGAALRSRVDLEVEVRKTRVLAEGVLVADGSALSLALATGEHVPVLVTVDGVREANAHVGARVRMSAYLMPSPDEPGLVIAQPAFE